MPPGPYRVTTCRERELTMDDIHTFFTTQGLPRKRDQLNGGATSVTTQTWKTIHIIPTSRIWNDDYDGQMIFWDLVGLKLPDIGLTGEEKPRKTLTQETCPDRGSNLGPLRDSRACYSLLQSGGPVWKLNEKNSILDRGLNPGLFLRAGTLPLSYQDKHWSTAELISYSYPLFGLVSDNLCGITY